MTQPFGHEKLIVYQKGMRFATIRSALIDGLPRRVAACDHLYRGAESILINIAHANSTWSPTERIVYLGHANGSALECAVCLDIIVAKNLIAEGNGRFTGTDQARFYDTAYKATIQSAGLIDFATTNDIAVPSRIEQARELIRHIAAMLTGLSKSATPNPHS